MKILTATALLLAIALPASAQVGPAYSNRVSDNITYGTVCTVERGSRLSVRSGPGKNYRVLDRVIDGRMITLGSYQSGRDGFQWVRTFADGRRQGWVRADYICDTHTGY
jgi:uncharacterized protein YgiM (DUF1202 family)